MSGSAGPSSAGVPGATGSSGVPGPSGVPDPCGLPGLPGTSGDTGAFGDPGSPAVPGYRVAPDPLTDRGGSGDGGDAGGSGGSEPALTVGLGAMHDTRTIVASVIAGCGKAAERARGLAERLGADGDRLLVALGGGPPSEVREAGARNRDATRALDDAATALQEAAIALASFNRRTT